MTHLEDRDWDRILERVDLEMSDADLAAAERQMAELPADEVVDVRPEWVEATVATATAPVEVVPEQVVEPARRWGWLRGVQRWAAAAIAFIGLHGTATAITVTTVTVGAVVVVSLLWPGMQNSRDELDYQLALEILLSEDEPLEAKQAAIFEAGPRIVGTISLLRRIQETNPSGAPAFVEATALLAELRGVLLEENPDVPVSVDDTFEESFRAAEQGSIQALKRITGLSAQGIRILRRLQAAAPLLNDRDTWVGHMRTKAGLPR